MDKSKIMVVLHRNDADHANVPTEMSFSKAEALLQYQVKKGYKHYSLPTDSKFEFKDGNLINRTGKAEAGKTA
jgi:hypothetical protein